MPYIKRNKKRERKRERITNTAHLGPYSLNVLDFMEIRVVFLWPVLEILVELRG